MLHLIFQNNKSFEDGELIQPPPRPKSAIPFDQSGRAYNDIPKYGGKGQQTYIVSLYSICLQQKFNFFKRKEKN